MQPDIDQGRDDLYRRALERTIPAEDFTSEAIVSQLEKTVIIEDSEAKVQSYLLKTSTDATEGTSSENDETETGQCIEVQDISSSICQGLNASGKRFDVVNVIGKGATARVLAVRDNLLHRTIAVKMLRKHREKKPRVRDRFIREAQVTASLEHPNIMPVYDMGVDAKNELFFAMKNIRGHSLGQAIRRAVEGKDLPEEFRTVEDRVRIFLKVCDALTYAHFHGYIHQDIKPDNIMVGDFGEVLLLDWGSALHQEDQCNGERLARYGTPAYMSPEQARREAVDERSDVYCLGATLFHALLLRHPTWASDPDSFWQKKRNGIIDLPLPRERQKIPKRLLAIVMKAMAITPEERYGSVSELADDLRNYETGMAVSAYREGMFERFGRWYRRNRRAFWGTTVGSLVVALALSLFFRERIHGMLRWRLLAEETFSYGSTAELSKRWEAVHSSYWQEPLPDPLSDSGGWRIEQGALHGYGHSGFRNIAFKRRITGDMRIEWEVTPLTTNQNINCFIAGDNRFAGYTFHLGGYSDPRFGVLTRGREMEILDQVMLPEPLEVNRTYAMRMEKEGAHLRFWIDGTRIMDFEDPDPLGGTGHTSFGFENNKGNHVVIDNVRIYHHPLPLKVSPIQAARRIFNRGLYDVALGEYREIAEAYPEKDIGMVARYGQARCLIAMDSSARAIEVLTMLLESAPDHRLAPYAMGKLAALKRRAGEEAAGTELYMKMAARFKGHPVLRSVFFGLSEDAAEYMNRKEQLLGAGKISIKQWSASELEKHREIVGWAEVFDVPLEQNWFLARRRARAVDIMSLPLDTVVDRYVHQRGELAKAMVKLGRYERVLDSFADRRSPCALSLARMGRIDTVLRHYADCPDGYAEALLLSGDFEAALRVTGAHDFRIHSQALCSLGRHEEALDMHNRGVMRAKDILPLTSHYREVHDWIEGRSIRRGVRNFVRSHVTNKSDSLLNQDCETVRSRGGVRWSGYLKAMLAAGKLEKVLEVIPPASGKMAERNQALLALGRSRQLIEDHREYPSWSFAGYRDRGLYTLLPSGAWRLDSLIVARREAGEQELLLREFDRRPRLRAELLLELERPEEVLARYPEQRSLCAEALLRLGRYEEVLRDYPEWPGASCRALIALGKSDKARKRFPGYRDLHARELMNRKRYAEVAAEYIDKPLIRSRALVLLGREEQIPYDSGAYLLSPRDRFTLHRWWGMREYAAGNRRRAEKLFAREDQFWFTWPPQRFGKFLLLPVLLALEGEPAALQAAGEKIDKDHRYHFAQRLWHEARFIGGQIGEEEFLNQPFKLHASDRLLLCRAIKADIAGDTAAAQKDYRAFLAIPRHRRVDLLESPTVEEFVRWRVGDEGHGGD